jgi:hypothetical protein
MQLWGEMRATGVDPDRPCFTAVLAACRGGRRWRMALDVLEQVCVCHVRAVGSVVVHWIWALAEPVSSSSSRKSTMWSPRPFHL